MASDGNGSAAGGPGLAALLRGWRGRALLTQEQLAERAGVTVRTIRRLETGAMHRPHSNSVRLLADALGLTGEERTLLVAVARGEPMPRPAARPAIPRQLPADVTEFAGRRRQLGQLDALVLGVGGPATVVISAIAGTAGVGKTALAVHWAHRVADRFPDGQLYVNLRGYDPDEPMAPADALARLLAALGVAGQDIPLEVDERAARYRTETAQRRMLIVLDNAATAEQVRPLLPGTPSCRVLVTSRDSLAGLVAGHGAHRIDLDLLPPVDAIALLRRLIGRRADAEPDATAVLAAQCARLPLALRVAAELAVARPDRTVPELVAELADQQRRLDLLDAGGDPRVAVAAVLSWSVRHLPPDAAHAFALLGLHPGADFDGYAAAALAGIGVRPARRILGLLAGAHLVHATGSGRHGMHDLLRAYAASLTTASDTASDPRAALGRLFDYYLAAAAAAMSRLHPAEAHRRPRISTPGIATPELADPDAARRWLDTERPTLAAVAAYTARHGWPTHTVRLSATLSRYLSGGHCTDALTIHTHGRDAARQSGDRAGEAQALCALGVAHVGLGRYELAPANYEQALDLYRQAGDRSGQARTLNNQGLLDWRLGRHVPATDRLRQALALYRQVGDRTGEAHVLNDLGMVGERLGRYEEAVDHLRQALAMTRQLGDRSGEAHALNDLGLIEQRLGRHGAAVDHLDEAVALFRQLGDRSGEAWTLDSLGTAHTRLGRPDQADRHCRAALDLFRDIGERDGEAWALNGLGEAAHAAGNPTDAVTHHTAARRLAADTGVRDQLARAHAGLGHAYHALGEHSHAREQYEHGLTLYTDLCMPEADDIRARLTALAVSR